MENRLERFKKADCMEWKDPGENECRGVGKIRTAHSFKAGREIKFHAQNEQAQSYYNVSHKDWNCGTGRQLTISEMRKLTEDFPGIEIRMILSLGVGKKGPIT